MPQSLAQIWVHMIFSTKDRRPFLEVPAFREEMFRMLSHHVKESKCISASIGGHIDHVHLLVGLSRTITIAQLVENVKTETSKWARLANGRAFGPDDSLQTTTQASGRIIRPPTWARQTDGPLARYFS